VDDTCAEHLLVLLSTFFHRKGKRKVWKIQQQTWQHTTAINTLMQEDVLHDADFSSNVSSKKVTADTLKQYEIEYEKVMKHEELVQMFQKHLKKEFNTEPIECFMEITKFNQCSESDTWQTMGDNIESTYLKTGALKEVNIPGNIKANWNKNWKAVKELLNSKEQQEKQQQVLEMKKNLFIEVLVTLNTSLKIDSFPRFIR
jgi:hypothetical protein